MVEKKQCLQVTESNSIWTIVLHWFELDLLADPGKLGVFFHYFSPARANGACHFPF